MCTVINISSDKHYFGRTLDMVTSPGESVAVVPRDYPLTFGSEGRVARHHAFTGTAHLRQGVPLFYDAVNELGLCCAALRFADECVYADKPSVGLELSSFELIPYVMAHFGSVGEAICGLKGLSISSAPFSKSTPASPLHYIISDGGGSVIIESTKGGVSFYESDMGVLTNSPEYPIQLAIYGSGATFDPLDLSSSARFCKGVRLSKKCTPKTELEMSAVMGAVSVIRGLDTGAAVGHRTVYTAVIDSSSCKYTVRHESSPLALTVSLMDEALDSSEIKIYELKYGGVQS